MKEDLSQTNSARAAITLFDGDLASVLAMQSRGGRYSVWYFGDKPGRLQKIEAMLPTEAQIGEHAVALEKFADAAEGCLLDLFSQVSGQVEDRLAWDVSLLADLSPYAGNLQLNVSRYFLMEQILRTGGRHLFLVDDADMGKALVQAAVTNGLKVSWLRRARNSRYILGGLRARASVLKMLWRHKRVAKSLQQGMDDRWDALRKCDVLIVDWASATTFSVNKPTEFASNLERMPQIFQHANLKTGYIANPLYWLHPFSDIAKNCISAHDPVVLVDECLSLTSIIKGAWKTWRLHLRLNASVSCVGQDITALFKLEGLRDLRRTQPTRAYAYTDIAKILAQNGVFPKSIVYPFENQGWERAFMAGVRQHLPDCRLVAYQHCPFSSRMISFFPSKSDIPHRIADNLIVMGPHYAALFIDHGLPKNRVVVGGSLRFERQMTSRPQRREGVAGAAITVLCSTSIEYSESMDLVLKAVRAIRDFNDVKLIVNFHPKVDDEFIDNMQSALEQFDAGAKTRVIFSRQSATELLATADVLLYNHSGAALDALLLGRAAIFVSVDGALNYDKIPDAISQRVQTAKQLNEMLRLFFSDRKLTSQDVVSTVGGCIAPVDEAAIVSAVMGK